MLRNALEPWHILVVVLVLVVLFGSKKLPDTARSLGKSMRILKSEAKALKTDDATATVTTPATAAPATTPAAPSPAPSPAPPADSPR
ncbi:Sec-independent protein translocase subunit TatA [Streptomyces albireticuli]|uniref:Sec-independent protein translocase subunit TatA n=1 Tax=Streptomyces albireticuli TaxID=1940 RepID=UPI001E60EEAD|nr:Sec-independent protein translocase subunit TatA [Streptomyces albireticuli]MCD9142446.1 Sec-independent protein translocase subunit TatA [Streptomyces albireticuli]MCD9163846.1 Sec-independent protein translocase subunit TatA [Streptomyces albireticuli]MCD9192574.1 Sec-independent protein translocase subunit TatA [Streptomyces albireticuli]